MNIHHLGNLIVFSPCPGADGHNSASLVELLSPLLLPPSRDQTTCRMRGDSSKSGENSRSGDKSRQVNIFPVRQKLPDNNKVHYPRLYCHDKLHMCCTGAIYCKGINKASSSFARRKEEKNSAYGRQRISRPMRLVAPIPQ